MRSGDRSSRCARPDHHVDATNVSDVSTNVAGGADFACPGCAGAGPEVRQLGQSLQETRRCSPGKRTSLLKLTDG